MRDLPVRVFRAALRCAVLTFLLPTTGWVAPAFSTTPVETAHFIFVPHGVDRVTIDRVAVRAESQYSHVESFLGHSVAGPPIRCHIYPTLEAKGLATGYTRPSHSFGASHESYLSVEAGFDDALPREVATLVLHRALGRPAVEAFEVGLAVYVADEKTRGIFEQRAGRLAAVTGEGRLRELLVDRSFHGQSYLAMEAMAYALVSHLVKQWGKDEFLSRYSSWEKDDAAIDALDPSWRDYLAALAVRTPAPRSARSIPEFQRGFCHAHEGYQVHNGYISRKSDEALEKLATLGTDAVSVTPFTYMRTPRRPARLPFSHSPGAENDEAVIHAALAARRLGMTVMLKPHVWLNGSWPGEVEMSSEDEWELFFDHYWRWIRHYALLAQAYDIDILCVGVELSKTTLAQEARWVDLVEKVRKLYGGKVVYAANWGDEFEEVGFWSSFDYIGVNCYYPLAKTAEATDEELFGGATAALDRIEAVSRTHDVPVIITEVGFTSSAAPWVTPYERNRSTTADARAQARCYEMFFRALKGRKRIAGLYWWKWPSFLGYGGAGHSGFTPNGKDAEDVVKRWYGSTLAE